MLFFFFFAFIVLLFICSYCGPKVVKMSGLVPQWGLVFYLSSLQSQWKLDPIFTLGVFFLFFPLSLPHAGDCVYVCVVLDLNPGATQMQGMCCTIELHPQP